MGLAPFTYGHLQLAERGHLPEARAILNALLPPGVALSAETDGERRPLFTVGDVSLPFSALSDGFRGFVSWVWDLLYQLRRLEKADGGLVERSGVVIVDEIDLFLHPEWQRRVVQDVAGAFPKLQFLFSSHSPLVAGVLEPEHLYVLADRENDRHRCG